LFIRLIYSKLALIIVKIDRSSLFGGSLLLGFYPLSSLEKFFQRGLHPS
jgi:hypothetical protein